MGETYPKKDRLRIPASSCIIEAIRERRGLEVGSLVEFETLGGGRRRGRITQFFMMGKEPFYFCRVRVGRENFDKGVCRVGLAGAIDQLAGLVKHDRKKSKRRNGRHSGRRRRR